VDALFQAIQGIMLLDELLKIVPVTTGVTLLQRANNRAVLSVDAVRTNAVADI